MAARGCTRALVLLAGTASLAGCVAQGPVIAPQLDAGGAPQVELAETPFFPQRQFQCGPAALATVLVAAAVETDADALAPEVYLPGRHGSLQPELVAATRRHDRVPYLLPPTTEALVATLQGGLPILVLQKLGAGPIPGWHYAVVVGYDAPRDRFVLRSGTERRKEMPASHFVATWDRAGRWAMVALQPGAVPRGADFARYMEAVAGLEAVGRRDAAERAYEAAAGEWPAEPLPQLALGNLAYARGDLVTAERRFHAATRLAPGDVAARNNRADVLRQLGCSTLARREIEVARTLAGDGALAATVASTASVVAAAPDGDAIGCPTD